MNAANATLHRQVEGRLVDHGIRYTPGRRQVVAALAASDGPLSVADLSVEFEGDIPQSTIYRTISVLEEVGVVVPHLATREMARYELAEWLTGHHHHLVCVVCGRVDDIELADDLERQLDELVSTIGSTVAFRPSNHALEIDGRCPECA
ncbi:MAG: transcriptional repressor [Acidimicrobiia bacterium]|nr:transcriptional repressor [Acidimicrobiia bacterium]